MWHFFKKSIYFLIFISFISNIFFLFSISSLDSNNLHHYNSNCHYVLGDDVLCNLNILDLINKWSLFLLIVSVGNIFLIHLYFLAPLFLFSGIAIFFIILLFLKKKIKPPILYQILFSEGILNSKAY